jgi:hypothetical protein
MNGRLFGNRRKASTIALLDDALGSTHAGSQFSRR